MASSTTTAQHKLPVTATSHPDDPIPCEPNVVPQLAINPKSVSSQPEHTSPKSSGESILWSQNSSDDSEAPMTPNTEPDQAGAILRDGHADVVLLARAVLREPAWPQRAAAELGVPWREAPYPPQYTRGAWPKG